MPWKDIIAFIFPNATNFKAITSEFRALKDEWKAKAKEQEERIRELEGKVEQSEKEILDLQEHEKVCHQMLIKANETNRNLVEWIRFELKMKPPKI
jgi:TolA-binding protein